MTMKTLVLRAMLDVVDRSASTMAAACVVAALLGTVIKPDKIATAFLAAFIFFALAFTASILKTVLAETEDSP